tara:strand:+ start:313 stop:687 length:375 start_codon:yes stop_codon:yes gene_type:complete
MKSEDIKKLYYSIGEVSEMTGLKQYVLRFWESEFSQLNPNKNRAGNRVYRTIDIDLINEIKSLLYDRKFTIQGAKNYLKGKDTKDEKMLNLKKMVAASTSENLQFLKDIKSSLDEILDILHDNK